MTGADGTPSGGRGLRARRAPEGREEADSAVKQQRFASRARRGSSSPICMPGTEVRIGW